MERKIFELPTHPLKGKQKIVIEKPNKNSVWYLVLDEKKAKPLVNLKNPKSAKEILNSFQQDYGEGNVFQFISQGYSRCK